MNCTPFAASFLDISVNILYHEPVKDFLGVRNLSLIELFLIALGLSMDAFAVSICKGLGTKNLACGRPCWQAFTLAVFRP